MVVHEGVEECDDGNQDDTDACVGMCVDAGCGDGFVHNGVEECDDGNMDNTDACTTVCEAAACGDNFVQNGEECDDGNNMALDGCSAQCDWEIRLVFTTSSMHNGNLGGLVGADAICNARAQEAALPGTYMAWIATNIVGENPAARFVQSAVPYHLPSGTKVADNWADLIDGTLDAAISGTETGGPSPMTANASACGTNRIARTGTAADGTALVGLGRCSNFTSSASNSLGTPGVTTSANPTWTNCDAPGPGCDILMPIYCFQQ
jgi:cysteine-rich repeat protein